MGFYPVFLELAGRPCVVVGGGPIARRKVEGLLEAGAAVTVVSPALEAGLATLAREGHLRHVARAYRPGDLAGAQLAFVATPDGAVNATVAREGRAQGVWVNAADDPERCDFILPSVLRRGALQVAVGTGGASPALARAVREELEGFLGEDYAALAEVVAEARTLLRARGRAPDAAAWRRVLDGDLRRLIADGRRDEARARLLEELSGERCG
jgi:siroheme synthase-like protein